MTATCPLTFDGIKKLWPLRKKFHTTDIVVQVLHPRHSGTPKPLPHVTVSDGCRYLPALFAKIDEAQLEGMYLGIYRIKLALICPLPQADTGFCNTLVVQSFEKCAGPSSGIIGKLVEDFSQYRGEGFPVEDVVPIAVLSLFPKYSRHPTIRARVTYKSRLHDPYQVDQWPGVVVHLMDESSEIQANVGYMSRNLAKEIHDRLEEGKIYYFSNLYNTSRCGCLSSNLKNDAVFGLSRRTVIEECTINTDLPPYSFHLSMIPELHRMEKPANRNSNVGTIVDHSVDVIGIVSKVFPIYYRTMYMPSVRVPVRHITIFDQSGISLSVILWSYNAEEFTACQGDIVAFRNAHLVDYPSGEEQFKKYQDVTCHRTLSALTQTTVHVEPDIEACCILRCWYNTAPPEALQPDVGFNEWESIANLSSGLYDNEVFGSDAE